MLYRLICYLVFFSGLSWVTRKLKARKKVTIILYHNPAPEVFRRHLRFLKGRYHFITLADLVTAIRSNRFDFKPYALVITFDDGHKGNYELLDVIREYNVAPTIYLCSSVVNSNRKFWFRLPTVKSSLLKGMENKVRLQTLKDLHGFEETRQYPEQERHSLNLGELQSMSANVDFQSHTRFHPLLTTCTDDEAKTEIGHSKVELKEMLGRDILHFAFPNGDYSEREIEMLKASGYHSARTTDIGWNDRHTDPFRLKITGVSDASDNIMFQAELSGIPGYFYNIFKSGLSLKSISGKHVPECEKP